MNVGSESQKADVECLEWRAKFQELKSKAFAEPEDGVSWLDFAEFLDDECDMPVEALYAYKQAQRLLSHLDLRLGVGPALIGAGKDEEGIALIESFANEKRTRIGYCSLGANYIRIDRYSEARNALLKAIKLEPTFEESWYLMGNAYRWDELVPVHVREWKACLYYRKAIRLDPQYQLAWSGLGQVLTAWPSSEDEGINALERALSLKADDGWSMLYLAAVLDRKGITDEAERFYKRAIAVFPHLAESRERYSDFLRSHGRTSDSERVRTAELGE